MNKRIPKNDFLENLKNDWKAHQRIEAESFEIYIQEVHREIKNSKIEFCDNERDLDFKVLEEDEQELYLETFDKNLRMACGLVQKQEYISNAMFISKLQKNELLLLKYLLLNQLKEIDLILKMKEKLNLRDRLLCEDDFSNNTDEEDDFKLCFLNEEETI